MEKMWFELGKQFAHKGHQVCHISRCFPGLPSREEIDGVLHQRVQGFDTPRRGLVLKGLDLLYSLRARQSLPKADILVTNTFWMPILAADDQCRTGRIMVDVQRMPKGQMRFYHKAASLRANSLAVQRAIAQEAPKLTSHIYTIPNPLPFSVPLSQSLKTQAVILYCGRLHPEKGIELLIRAFSEACKQGLHGWTLRLVGPADVAAGGGGLAWLQSLLAQPQADGLPLEWLGPVYDSDALNRHYQDASIFVYPSLAENGETFGVAPLEAMASGAVPIVSALDCFRDFITPGVNGLVFDHRSPNAASLLSDQILDLAADRRQRESFSLSARRVSHSHHPATIADAFLHCFEDMIVAYPCH